MPWLPVPDPRLKNDNVISQQADPESLWSLYHDLLTLRRSTPALPGGESLLLQVVRIHGGDCIQRFLLLSRARERERLMPRLVRRGDDDY